MKKFQLLFFVFICSVFALQAQKTTKEEIKHPVYGKAVVEKIVDKNNRLTQKLIYTTDSLFTKGNLELGDFVSYHNNGEIEAKGSFVTQKKTDLFGQINRNKTGKWFFYNEKGKLSGIVNYKDDKQNGEYINYHDNGKVLGKGIYSDGSITGDAKLFFKNGNLHRVIAYKKSKPFNVKEFYDKNGNKLNFGTFKDGNGTLKIYDLETGKYTKTYTYENGIPEDVTTKITKTSNGEFKELIYKYNNNNTRKIVRFLNGELNGLQQNFNYNGTLDESIEYIKGVKNGKHIAFNDDGTLFYEFTYVNGKKTGPFKETPEGTKEEYYVLDEGFYNDKEERTGKYTSYLMDKKTVLTLGKLDKKKAVIVTSGQYENGKKIGEWKQFDPKGNIVNETNHSNKASSNYSKKEYYKSNGSKNIKSSVFYDNKTNKGTYEKYYPNGQLKLKSVLKNKSKIGSTITYLEGGKYVEYYEDGTLKVVGQKEADAKKGLWKWYNEKGLVLKEYTYSGHCCFTSKRKDYNYNNDGKLSSIIIQDDHKQNPLNENEYFFGLTTSKDFNENGTLRELESKVKTKYRGYGKKEGLYQRYSSTSGELEVEGNYKQDKKDGIWKYYNHDGKLSSKSMYVLGDEIGPFEEYEYHKNNTKSRTRIGTNFKGGYKHTMTYYYDNGKIKETGDYERVYKDNVKGRVGLWKKYYENGKLEFVGNYVEGYKEGDWVYYYSNSKIASKGAYLPVKKETIKLRRKLKEEAKIGNWKYFEKDGTLKEKTSFKLSSDYKYIIKKQQEYYNNGKLKSKKTFHNKREKGIHKEFFENGKLSVISNYDIDDEIVGVKEYYSNGNLKCTKRSFIDDQDYSTGIYTFYYENGKLKIQMDFDEEGYLKNVLKYYDSKGAKLDVGTLKDGNGTLKHYNKNNEVIRIENFEDGESYE